MEMDAALHISYDRFIRTTSPEHKRQATELWRRVEANGDIALATYEGWYNKYDEAFVTNADAELAAKNEAGVPLDAHGRPYEKRSEAAYFFKMSRYAARLREHIATNPGFIQPEYARADICKFLESTLQDLCVSRPTLTWGIPCPDKPPHVMYVWFDALTNYLTGVDGLGIESGPDAPPRGFWPADVHIIGKDIIRFHCVYWPCMLMAAGVPLPKAVFAHGFVSGADGQKMSKSLGNTRDPHEQLALYGVDALRYYLCRSAPYGFDLPYNEEALVSTFNDVLLKGFGNLVQRACRVCAMFAEGKVPAEPALRLDGTGLPFDLVGLQIAFERCFAVRPTPQGDGLQIREALQELERALNATNAYVDKSAPWKHKDEASAAYRRAAVRGMVEGVFALAHFFHPFIPGSADKALARFSQPRAVLSALRGSFDNVAVGSAVANVDEVLFKELEVGVGIKAQLGSIEEALARKSEHKQAVKETAEQRRQDKAAAKQAPAVSAIAPLDVRVGVVVEASAKDSLLVLKVDAGVGDAVDVVSGIAAYYTPAQVLGRRVAVVLNLEPFAPKALPGFLSRGVLLTAKDGPDTVELVLPPAQSAVGASLGVAGGASGALKPRATDKQWAKAKKTLAAVAGVVQCEQRPLADAAEAPCTTERVLNGPVS